MTDTLLIKQVQNHIDNYDDCETASLTIARKVLVRIVTALEAQQEMNEKLIEAANRLPEGEWETWTSCSFRRIGRKHCRDGGVVLRGVKQSDGHPDLSWNEELCNALCDLVNGIRALPHPPVKDSSVRLIDRIHAEFDKTKGNPILYYNLAILLWPDQKSHQHPTRGGPPGCYMALSRCLRENNTHIDYEDSVAKSLVFRPKLRGKPND
ncbi:MAG: hypothetical protein GY749_22950 [Desulfobacteraceae bacterium]|nr:hypothetical protein [Desulfobacteraceae bacterium]